MVSQPTTYLKALASAACSTILPWLVGLLAAWTLSLGFNMPDSVQSGIVALIAGLVVYWVPNADPAPSDAERIKQLEDQIAKLQAGPPLAKP